jgi:prevent-host-death family protein
MKAVAVSELKASLSRFLAAVKGGEEVIVTDRGKPVAKLIPVTRNETAWPTHLLALERAGLAKIGTGGLPHGFWDLERPKDPTNRVLESLLTERAESR